MRWHEMKDLSEIVVNKLKDIKPSGIRKYFDLAAEMQDVISLGVGEPDFMTPLRIREAGIKSLEAGQTKYTANAGLAELRQEVANYLDRKLGVKYNAKSEVFITIGGSEAIDLCIRAIISDGDEMLLPEPCFVCYDPLCRMAGGTTIPIQTKQEDNFKLTADELRKAITPRTKLLVLPFPNNPTGGIMRREDLEEIAEVLKDTDIMVLSDEIYSELTYGGEEHVSLAEIEGMRDRTIIVNGFSKAFAMTGWRLGYAAGPEIIIKQMIKLHQFAIMCPPTTAQYAAVVALRECDDEVVKMREEYDSRRKYIVNAFNELGLETFTPEGAFYCFPCIKSTGLSSDEFCETLLKEKQVAVIPGNAFGECGEGYIRVSYSYSMDHLKEAIRRIKEFLTELKK